MGNMRYRKHIKDNPWLLSLGLNMRELIGVLRLEVLGVDLVVSGSANRPAIIYEICDEIGKFNSKNFGKLINKEVIYGESYLSLLMQEELNRQKIVAAAKMIHTMMEAREKRLLPNLTSQDNPDITMVCGEVVLCEEE